MNNHTRNKNHKIKAHILVIDDDQILGDMMCRHFEYLQHKSACAYSLREGLKLLKGSDFDVVFLDVHLPDGDGLSAIPDILTHPVSRNCQRLVLGIVRDLTRRKQAGHDRQFKTRYKCN